MGITRQRRQRLAIPYSGISLADGQEAKAILKRFKSEVVPTEDLLRVGIALSLLLIFISLLRSLCNDAAGAEGDEEDRGGPYQISQLMSSRVKPV